MPRPSFKPANRSWLIVVLFMNNSAVEPSEANLAPARLPFREAWGSDECAIRLVPVNHSNVCDLRGGDRNPLIQTFEHQLHPVSDEALREPDLTAS